MSEAGPEDCWQEVRSLQMCCQPAVQGRMAFTSPQEGIGRKCSRSYWQYLGLGWEGKRGKKRSKSAIIWGTEGFHIVGIPCQRGITCPGSAVGSALPDPGW